MVQLSLHSVPVGCAAWYELSRRTVEVGRAAAATARRLRAAETGTTTRLSPGADRSRRRAARTKRTPRDTTHTAAPTHSSDAINMSLSVVGASTVVMWSSALCDVIPEVVVVIICDVTCSPELTSSISYKLALFVSARTVHSFVIRHFVFIVDSS